MDASSWRPHHLVPVPADWVTLKDEHEPKGRLLGDNEDDDYPDTLLPQRNGGDDACEEE